MIAILLFRFCRFLSNFPPQPPGGFAYIALLSFQLLPWITSMAFSGGIHHGGLDNLHSNFISRFQLLYSPLNMLTGRANKAADLQMELVPVLAGNVVNNRGQYAVVPDARHAEALAVQVNLERYH